MLPLGPCICDSCHEPIEMEDGWVEFLVGEDESSSGLRIVHHMTVGQPHGYRCSYDSHAARRKGFELNDFPLSRFVGPDGLTEILWLQAFYRLPVGEVSRLIQRLHVPGFEQASRHFDSAILEGIIDPPSTPGFFYQEDIEAVWNRFELHKSTAPRRKKSA